jgi:hypothetical protein
MSINPTSMPDDASLERVKEQLRSLSAIDPPQSLRSKLMADIPTQASRGARGAPARWWFKAIGYGAVAAVVVAGTSAIIRLAGSSARAPGPIGDVNDDSSRTVAADYNSVRPLDSNVYDNNGL